MTHLKICGFTRPDLVAQAASLAIDAYGFVFAENSRRRITPEEFARFPLDRVKSKVVGVFVRPTLEEIEAVVRANRLDMIQLHGGEERSFVSKVKEHFRLPLIWAVKGTEESLRAIREEREKEDPPFYDILLIDTGGKGFGGQGIPFDWRLIPRFREAIAPYPIPLWVAGGINPDNVEKLIKRYSPDGIDVSSGVEEEGVKSLPLIEKMVKKVKG